MSAEVSVINLASISVLADAQPVYFGYFCMSIETSAVEEGCFCVPVEASAVVLD